MKLTAVYVPCPEGGFAAFVEELPGANTQGETIEEARANLAEAVEMVLDANRILALECLTGTQFTTEPFVFAPA
jgi:predicted RNase H-like HicB family nuclease